MTTGVERWSLLHEVGRTGGCVHPVRLAGVRVDPATGELVPDTLAVACKDRRAVICPACSAVYQGDAWHLVAAGLRGGKGVPDAVASHPRLFVTLTAPSFGPVHSRPRDEEGGPCRPGRTTTCAHGEPRWCAEVHDIGDPVLGTPLCAECFDYTGAVLWNAHASRLWRRTTVVAVRSLARRRGASERSVRREVRLSFVKVAEFQRRGLVHFHVVVRVDAAAGHDEPVPAWADVAAMADALLDAAAETSVPWIVAPAALEVAALDGVPRRHRDHDRCRWGRQIDIRALEAGSGADAMAVAAYVAKYATKTSDAAGLLARPVRSLDELERLPIGDHASRLVMRAWELGADPRLAPLRLRAHAHTFAYPGHFTTKSHRYSTTFGALRQARADHHDDAVADVDGHWRFSGRGYDHPDAERLAEALAEARAAHRRTLPTTSPTHPHPADLG